MAMPHKSIVSATLLEIQSDTAADDSDKIITVDSDERWHVFAIYVSLVSTATVGNRQLQVDFRDDSNNVFCSILAGATQAASLTYNYSLAPGLPHLTAVIGTNLMTPMPATMLLKPGWDIRIYDNAAVDAAADDMTVRLLVDRVKTLGISSV